MYQPDNIYLGDARELASNIAPGTVVLSVWSPPYHVGKDYELNETFMEWKSLLRRVIQAHSEVLRPGGFLAINIADILCYKDPNLPRQALWTALQQKRQASLDLTGARRSSPCVVS